MKGKFKKEETYVYLWLIHVDVWQKPAQYCKAIILQLKINLKDLRDLPDGPVAKSPCFQCRGPRFDPWSGS